jgi:hypothetical protein
MHGMDQASQAAYETNAKIVERDRDASRVELTLASVADAHDRLVHQIDRLVERLRPMLQPESDMAMLQEGGVAPSTPKSPHVHALEDQARRANAMADQLSALIDRLDV